MGSWKAKKPPPTQLFEHFLFKFSYKKRDSHNFHLCINIYQVFFPEITFRKMPNYHIPKENGIKTENFPWKLIREKKYQLGSDWLPRMMLFHDKFYITSWFLWKLNSKSTKIRKKHLLGFLFFMEINLKFFFGGNVFWIFFFNFWIIQIDIIIIMKIVGCLIE